MSINAAMQKILKAIKASSATELTLPASMKLNKDSITGFLKNFVNVVEKYLEVRKLTAHKIDQLKNEQIGNQKVIIRTQQVVLNSVQTTVKEELKSWADVARSNNKQNMTVSVKNVKETVKTTLAEDDRSRNYMMYGLEETKEGEEDGLEDAVQALFIKSEIEQWPRLCSAYTMGRGSLTRLAPLHFMFSVF